MSMVDVEAEREVRLANLHPLFRQVDAAVAAYIDLVRDFPELSDEELERRLVEQGIEASLALGCVLFVPLAFGRVIITELGVAVSDTFIEYDRGTRRQAKMPLAGRLEFVWAKAVVDIYRRSPEYRPAFKSIAISSAEVDAVNNALNNGCPEEELRESKMEPPVVLVGEPKKRWWQFWKR